MVLVHFTSSHCHLQTKFHFKPFSIFQDMASTGINYEKKKWLMGDNSVNIQCRIMVLVNCHSSNCHLSIKQVSFLSLNSMFKDMTQKGTQYDKRNGY